MSHCPSAAIHPCRRRRTGKAGDLSLDRLARKFSSHSLKQQPHFFKHAIGRVLPADAELSPQMDCKLVQAAIACVLFRHLDKVLSTPAPPFPARLLPAAAFPLLLDTLLLRFIRQALLNGDDGSDKRCHRFVQIVLDAPAVPVALAADQGIDLGSHLRASKARASA